jgi:hypothetical protein
MFFAGGKNSPLKAMIPCDIENRKAISDCRVRIERLNRLNGKHSMPLTLLNGCSEES